MKLSLSIPSDESWNSPNPSHPLIFCFVFFSLVSLHHFSFSPGILAIPKNQHTNMVSTRRHPKEFPEPDLSPSRSRAAPSRKGQWAHTPSNLVLAWLMISLPLVMWDTGYVLLRPLSMPGGSLHWPLWVPYELYGRVDYIYGWKAFNAKNGFTSAQGTMNVVETVAYFYYLYILYAYGKQSTAAARGAPKSGIFSGGQRHVSGSMGGVAALIGFAVSVMTVSKTLLYCQCCASDLRSRRLTFK
jgi:hypothetical protein